MDTAAAVYIQFPSSPDFKLLGAIGNEKQSAIFKVYAGGGVGGASGGIGSTAAEVDMDADEPAFLNNLSPAEGEGGGGGGGEVTLGISIESSASIAAQLATLPPSISLQQPTPSSGLTPSGTGVSTPAPSTDLVLIRRPPSTKILAQRIIQNAFNFLASFAGGGRMGGGEEVVPLKAFRDWWVKFERRIEVEGTGFLEREDDG